MKPVTKVVENYLEWMIGEHEKKTEEKEKNADLRVDWT